MSLESACQRAEAPGPPPRYAVVRFENLSGDPMLDWLGRGASESLSASLRGVMEGPVLSPSTLHGLAGSLGPRPASAPGISTEREEALIAGANRLIAGYVERMGNQIRITATAQDLSTGKTLRNVSVINERPLEALNAMARELSRNPQAPLTAKLTSNQDALKAYAEGLEAPASESVPAFERAVQFDPSLGAAWVALVNTLARTDPGAARDAIDRARKQKPGALTAASLDLADADLRGDRAARLAALEKLVSSSPWDILLLRNLADARMAAGQFAAAASDFKRLSAELPNDFAVWNNLGYSRAYSGDYEGAVAALDRYARLRPRDANPYDSLGDVNYLYRKFPEAASNYQRAQVTQPGFEQYGDLYKASWATFHAGDNAGADRLFSQFRDGRGKTEKALLPLLAADWLYRTGRRGEGTAALRALAAAHDTAEATRASAFAQLIVWDLITQDRAQAAKDAAALGNRLTGTPNSAATMLIARFAALPSASAEEWGTRAERMIPVEAASLRSLAMGYALVFDGKKAEALPVWKGIASHAAATDFFSRAVYARLENKPIDHPLIPDPLNLNPFLVLLDVL